VDAIEHRSAGPAGDIIDIQARDGRRMRIEIPPQQRGEIFLQALMAAWESTGGRPHGAASPAQEG
jgi:hypothetical protein